ncbi:homeobox protein vent1-like [Halichoeres trimaculatus]|uniref:homeobox protein vent1-like n=1 Tax=Halichoeres trimaculatus TaxID=147232 RepID=UPI003D9E9575
MQITPRARPYKAGPRRGRGTNPSDTRWNYGLPSSTANMVKYFSVEWLAQSHHSVEPTEEQHQDLDPLPTSRPHVPCVVQPCPPTLGQSHLQLKPKASRVCVFPQNSGQQETSLMSSLTRTEICASPISETSGYSSGYESEPASSESLSAEEPTEAESCGPQRRVRSKFSPEQVRQLEKIFTKHKYLETSERVKTAQKLNLTETQVRTWFQNRRMKLKREVPDYIALQIPRVMFQSMAPAPYHNMPGERPVYPANSPAFYPLPVPQMVVQPQMPPPHHTHRVFHNQHFY